MRPRFSLRTLFLLTTAVAGLCLWFMLPTITAKRFVAAVAKEDYKSADTCFLYDDDRFLASASEKRWGFGCSAELLPLTVGQLCSSERKVRVAITYFEFDQRFSVETDIVATPFGLQKPVTSPLHRLGIIYDGRGDVTPAR